uniref:DnaJ homolog subfamily C member 21-like n=1 Tax=Hirondellea gigas TaxID=1518452 RepID=A0A2P2I104_9CRUS
MRCHYEVLQLSESATAEELKKSYKKLALKCHPDKNPGREAEANEEFKEICGAYTTLSDPQERAFYDRNKESILRGAGSDEAGRSSETLDVFKYFSTSCFPGGFTDAAGGFFAVYRSLFDELSLKDMKYMKEEDHHIPAFGYSSTDHEDAASFYGYWMGYCTSMPFAWADQIDVRQASCRYVEKKIERENRKHRDQEKKKFNEQVRNLVMFVRKRDPRWKDHLRVLEQRNAASAAKREQVQQRIEQERLLQREQDKEDQTLIKAKQEYLQQLKEMERQMRSGDYTSTASASNSDDGDSEGDDETKLEEEDDDDDEFELACLVCCKIFSSERTKELHMKTKKHKQKLAQLIQEEEINREEEEDDGSNEDEIECEPETPVSDPEDEPEPIPQTAQNKRDKKKRKEEKKLQKMKKKQQPDSNNSDSNADQEDSCSNTVDVTEEIDNRLSSVNINHEEKIEVSVEAVEGITVEACGQEPLSAEGNNSEEPAEKESHEKTKARLRAQKAKDNKKKGKKGNDTCARVAVLSNDSQQGDTVCRICQSTFTSKNKLFQHIKVTGHAVLQEAPNTGKKAAKTRKK